MTETSLDCNNELENGEVCRAEVVITLERGDNTQGLSSFMLYGEQECETCGYLHSVEMSA
jgi:hypothetical protein